MNDFNLTVVITTHNSETHLARVLTSVSQQSLPDGLSMTILVVDGASTDNTRQIAESFGAKVVHNEAVDVGPGKTKGLALSKGDYVMFLDHDEVLVSQDHVKLAMKCFKEHPNVAFVTSTGYLAVEGESSASQYSSEFGDPLSCFVYRQSMYRRLRTIDVEFVIDFTSSEYWVVGKPHRQRPLLLEATAAGTVIRNDTIHRLEKQHINALIPLTNVVEGLEDFERWAVLTNSPIQHFSTSNWTGLKRKIRWRTGNFFSDNLTRSSLGIRGRIRLESHSIRERKLARWTIFRIALFVIYSSLIIPVFFHAVFMSIARKRLGFMMHVPLSWYVLVSGLYQFCGKAAGRRQKIVNYDGSVSF